MKVSVNWLKQYLNFTLPSSEELVAKIGAQLGGVDEVIDLSARYKGVVVVKVVDCHKLEASDHLNVCKIDDGGVTQGVERDEKGFVQVVCGAPNVAAGVNVAWLPPGSTVPASHDEAERFILTARTLRGVVSNGMLASAKELAIGDSHEGLLLLESDIAPGTPFVAAYELDDTIIDIENKMFTHRPDCFGQLGIAREVAGILGQQFSSPDWYTQLGKLPQPGATKLPLTVINELPELVVRFMAIPMSKVTVKPSPVWLQTYLSRLGIRSINNIVDITNYVMLLTGQPVHAYDYDKVKALSSDNGAAIVVRQPRPSEQIMLLNGKTITPREEAIMIATDKQLIGLGGVMGGTDCEVDATTKNIILEVATFDMFSIRRTSMAHGLFTDAVTRFNKGQSPLQNPYVLQETVRLCNEHADAEVAGAVIDETQLQDRQTVYHAVQVAAAFVNQRLGLQLSIQAMQQLLNNVEFAVIIDKDELQVSAPFWRTDIELREDIVEEIGRLHGFDAIPLQLPVRTLLPAAKNDMLDLQQTLRSQLAKAGANEVLTYSFVHGNLLQKAGQNQQLAFRLSNALSPDLQYYRLSLTPSLLDKVHTNVKAGYDNFALFELGNVHATSEVDESGLPDEFGRLALVIADSRKDNPAAAAYYDAQNYLKNVVAHFNLWQGSELVPLDDFDTQNHQLFVQLLQTFEPSRSAVVVINDRVSGVVGEYRNAVRKALKLPDRCAGFELFLSTFKHGRLGAQYRQLPRFPKLEQDICLKVSATMTYRALQNFVNDQLQAAKPPNSLLELNPLDIYQRQDDLEHKQITFRVSLTSYERTLTDSEVSALLDKIASEAVKEFAAERI